MKKKQSDIDAGFTHLNIEAATQYGQTLVEFSLILPLLMLLLFGLIDFGIAVWKYDTVANIGREIARYGVVHPDEVKDHESKDFAKFVKDAFGTEEFERWTTGLVMDSLAITPTVRSDVGLFGSVQVTVTYRHRLLTGPVVQAVGGSHDITMKTVTSMNLEFPPDK